MYLTVSSLLYYKHINKRMRIVKNRKKKGSVKGRKRKGTEREGNTIPTDQQLYSPSRKSGRHRWRLAYRGTVLSPLQKAKGYHATVRHLEQSRDPMTLTRRQKNRPCLTSLGNRIAAYGSVLGRGQSLRPSPYGSAAHRNTRGSQSARIPAPFLGRDSSRPYARTA